MCLCVLCFYKTWLFLPMTASTNIQAINLVLIDESNVHGEDFRNYFLDRYQKGGTEEGK